MDNSHKIGDIYVYPKLKVYDGLLGKFPIRNPDLYLGIEIEAENVSNIPDYAIPGSWKAVEDGSLKVSGGEFVTVPIKFQFLEIELRRLFDTIKRATFSSRTSIHVHMNARDMTIQELSSFLILYMLFEKALYKYSGNRWNNNFCIPIYSAPSAHMVNMLNNTICHGTIYENWSKYHGLNLTPLYGHQGSSARLGTIEFRQMKGNNNIEYILNWCNLISSLKTAAKTIQLSNLIGLVETNNIQSIGDSVFGKWFSLLKSESYNSDLESCASRARYILFKASILENKIMRPISTARKPKVQEVTPPFIIDDLTEIQIPPSVTNTYWTTGASLTSSTVANNASLNNWFYVNQPPPQPVVMPQAVLEEDQLL